METVGYVNEQAVCVVRITEGARVTDLAKGLQLAEQVYTTKPNRWYKVLPNLKLVLLMCYKPAGVDS